MNRDLRRLRAAVSVAIHPLEIYDRPNPFAKFVPLPEPKKIAQWLREDQIRDVMREARRAGRNTHLIFALGIYAGLRKEEIIEARWEWIDFKHAVINVRETQFWRPKDKDERPIDLSTTLAKILKAHRDRVTGYIIEPENAATPKGYRYNFRVPYEKVTAAAGVPWCTAKRLRITFGSQLAINGAELHYIQRQLGHSDPTTTMLYAHLVRRQDYVDKIPAPQQAAANEWPDEETLRAWEDDELRNN